MMPPCLCVAQAVAVCLAGFGHMCNLKTSQHFAKHTPCRRSLAVDSVAFQICCAALSAVAVHYSSFCSPGMALPASPYAPSLLPDTTVSCRPVSTTAVGGAAGTVLASANDMLQHSDQNVGAGGDTHQQIHACCSCCYTQKTLIGSPGVCLQLHTEGLPAGGGLAQPYGCGFGVDGQSR